jgi:hypothetical protein
LSAHNALWICVFAVFIAILCISLDWLGYVGFSNALWMVLSRLADLNLWPWPCRKIPHLLFCMCAKFHWAIITSSFRVIFTKKHKYDLCDIDLQNMELIMFGGPASPPPPSIQSVL